MTEIIQGGPDSYAPKLTCQPGVALDDQSSKAALDLRLRYVEEMGWLKPGRSSDIDQYDTKQSGTVHVSHGGSDGEIVAAMRLTPMADFEKSISFREMIGSDYLYQDSVRRRLTEHSGQMMNRVQVWDLTRLVHETSLERSGQLLPAFLEMFGAGLAATVTRGDSADDAWWIFITTDKIRRTLSVCGIEYHDLGESSYDVGKESSYCCLVKPVEAMAKLQANPRKESAYRMVKSGFDTAVSIE